MSLSLTTKKKLIDGIRILDSELSKYDKNNKIIIINNKFSYIFQQVLKF